MLLTKTTAVPPGDADAVLNLPIIKMVVIVNDDVLAQLADDLAQMPPVVDRQVIWFPGGLPANYVAQFGIDVAAVLAFSLSPANTVGDTINQGEPLDETRIDTAYTKAGL